MSNHTLKGLRQQFKDVGKFHTPPELAEYLKSLITVTPREVYDPTCGAGSLLQVWGDEIPKYGQDIDHEALEDAERMLTNFHAAHGDVLTNPAWLDRKFHVIVANPPFSIKWQPQADERFQELPAIPTQSKADYAFIAHILYMLADDGQAAVLSFPGVLYRGGREGKIRQWLIENNYVSRVVHIPPGTFTDTTIPTAVLVIHKNKTNRAVSFVDREHNLERMVSVQEIRDNDYNLAVNLYVQPPEPEKPPIDPVALHMQHRKQTRKNLVSNLRVMKMVTQLDSTITLDGYREELITTINQELGDAA